MATITDVKFLVWLVTYAAGLAAATWLLDGIFFDGASSGSQEFKDKWLALLIVAAIQGCVTAWVAPVAKTLGFPFIVVTLGLFLLVINALMLKLTAAIAGGVGLDFHVVGFWTALWGSVIITFVTYLTRTLLEDDS